MKKKRHGSKRKIDYSMLFIIIVVTLMGIITLYPFIYVLSMSIAPPSKLWSSRVLLWPIGFSFVNFKYAFSNNQLMRGFLNSLIYTSVGTVLSVLVTMMIAYPVSQEQFKRYGSIVMKMIVVTMLFSGGLIPTFLLVKHLGLMNSMWAIVFSRLASPFYVILALAFMRELSKSIFDAAIMDGANEMTIFFRIVLPLSKPIMACLLLYYAVGIWNDFFTPLIYLNDVKKYPLQVFLRDIVIGSQIADIRRMTSADEMATAFSGPGVKAATLVISTIPILVVYPFVQKYFVRGIMVGAIKG